MNTVGYEIKISSFYLLIENKQKPTDPLLKNFQGQPFLIIFLEFLEVLEMMPWRLILFSVAYAVISYFIHNNKDLYSHYLEWFKILFNELINLSSFNLNLKQTSSEDLYYVMFVLRWPVSVCIFEVINKRRRNGYTMTPEESCRFPPQELSWTIHGIWNNRSSGNRCSSPPLERSEIENITAELNERWVQVKKSEDNFDFWRNQWNKHGACLSEHIDLNEAYKYFKQGVAWYPQFDPTAALLACGMQPDDKRVYNSVQMTECLREELNITSRIVLSKGNDFTFRDEISLLREIRFCLDRNFTMADCKDSDQFSFDFIYPRTVENENEQFSSFAILFNLVCDFSQTVCDLFNYYLNYIVT